MPSGGGTTSQTTTNQVTLTPEQRAILNQMMPGLQGHMSSPPEVYSGQRVADLTPAQQLSHQMISQAAGPGGSLSNISQNTQNAQQTLSQGGPAATYSPQVTAAQNQLLNPNLGAATAGYLQPNYNTSGVDINTSRINNNTSMAPVSMGPVSSAAAGPVKSTGIDPFAAAAMYDPQHNANLRTAAMMGPGQVGNTDPATRMALDRILSPAMLNVNSNPSMQAAISAATRPITDELTTKILPAIRSGAVATGTMGSNRQGIAEGLAIRDANRAMTDTSARMASDMYGQMLGAQTQTANAESGQLSNRLATLLQDESTRKGISGNVLSSLTGSTLGAESSRYSTDAQVAIANTQAASQRAMALAQIEAAMKTASMQAQSGQSIASMQAGNAGEIASMQAESGLEGTRLQGQASILGQGLQANTAGVGQALTNQAQNRSTSVDAMNNALQGTLQATTGATAGATALNAVGAQQQQQNQNVIGANMQQFTQEQYRQFQAMQDVAALIFGQIPTGSSSSSSGTNPGSVGNTASSVAQLGTMAAMMMMASERALKHKIKRLGVLNGMPFYSFEYIFSPIKQVGFMVDEVEQHMPSAVLKIGNFRYIDKRQAFSTALKEAA